MEINFKKPQIEDKAVIQEYLSRQRLYGCDDTFANIFLWADYYKVTFAIVKGALVFCSGNAFSFPFGAEDEREALEFMMNYAQKKQIPFQMYNLTKEMTEKLEQYYPEKFKYMEIRDSFDYIYETENLISLSGKKYHAKRNHINKFKELNWAYETITDINKEECLEMNQKWCRENGCQESESMQAEYCVIKKAFQYYKELELCGGLIRLDGRVIAFSMGEKINEDIFVVHIEKAFADIPGAYPMINREFAVHEAADCKYINREEDMGLEGLRKAKLSYHPAFLLEKYRAVFQEQENR